MARARTPAASRPSSGRTSTPAPWSSPPPTPQTRRERQTILGVLDCIVDMLGAMVGDHIEVVLHDLTRPESSILRIANGHVTGRRVGGAVLSGPRNDKGLAVLGDAMLMAGMPGHVPVFPYPTEARDGRALTSATVLFRDSSGQAFASLCLNADYGQIEGARALLARLLPRDAVRVEPAPVEAPDMEGLMREIIEASVRSHGKPMARLSKHEKTAAVETMFERGLFIVKGGVEKAAAALGVTRFTIYNYLDAIKERRRAEVADAATDGP